MKTLLRGLVLTAALLAGSPGWSAELRVGFINPTAPPSFWDLVITTMRAAAKELDIKLDVRNHDRSREKALSLAKEFAAMQPPLDYLIATNDLDLAVDIVTIADAAKLKVILLNNDIDPKEWSKYGEPRTKFKSWLGSLIPDHEGAGYGIATSVLTEAARVKTNRPLKVLALTGDNMTQASLDRVAGLKRGVDVVTKLLGPSSVELVDVKYLDWSVKGGEDSVREFVKSGPRIDVLWAANDPMALGGMTALREAGYVPGKTVLVGGLNWSQDAVDKILAGEMVVTHGGHFLLGAWSMVVLRDHADGRDFAEEDVRLTVPMGAIDLPVAKRFPEIGKVDWTKVSFAKFSKSRNPAIKRYAFTTDAVLAQIRSGN
jgi:ABC-type sugar transport system substrate-binding protein